MCRQSRLRGRIHARPSAGGLAALCASRFFLFHLAFSSSSSARPVPSRHVPLPTLPAGPGPLGPPLDLPRLRSPPTRSSRTNPPFPRYYLQFARYRVQVQPSNAHPRFYTSNREPTGYDIELTRFAFEEMLADESENSSIDVLENIRVTILA